MQKNLKNDVKVKYNTIFSNLNVQWKVQSINKINEMNSKGFRYSGIEIKEMHMLIEKLINKTLFELQQLFMNLPIKYNRKISSKDLIKYREKSKNDIINNINLINQDFRNIYINQKIFAIETNEAFINNIKNNSNIKIDELFNQIDNLQKGKKMKGLDKFNICITLINILITVVNLIVGIIK